MIVLALVAAAIAAAGLFVRLKVRRDAIYQDGAYAGSAIQASPVQPGVFVVRFLTLRTMPAFRPERPFQHGKYWFMLESWSGIDERSPLLRRYQDAICRVMASEQELGEQRVEP